LEELGGDLVGRSNGNIVWHSMNTTKQDRQKTNQHKSYVLWFTGLSGSGKSTLANALEKELYLLNVRSYVLDGDNIRHGLNKNLGFGEEDRKENIRRIGEVTKLFVDAGIVTLSAFISPYREDRDKVRALFEKGEFIEIYMKCTMEECERRDPKGLYLKAKAGLIKDFTGISAPYEEPLQPEIVIDSDNQSLHESVERILRYLAANRLLIH
jgi:adenylylsulfate kinase